MLNSQISPQWKNLILYKQTNWVDSYQSKKQKKKDTERVCNNYFQTACKVVKLKEEDVTLSTSLFMFHVISFSPHFIDHVSFLFLQSIVNLVRFTYHSPSCSCLPYLVVFILHVHSTSLSVSLFIESRLWKLTTTSVFR